MAPIEIQIGMDRWQHFLQPHHVVRIWRVGTMELVAELSVPLVVSLISQYLYQAALVTEIQNVTRRPLASAPPSPRTLPVVGRPPPELRAARRQARRAR